MPSQNPKGSEWRKWDLHVHTPASFEHGFGDWDDYIAALGEIRDIAVLGITDYFTIEGYKKILQLRDDGSLQNFSLVIPNIELRLNIFVPKRTSGEQQRRLNIHVLFSNEVKVEDIESQFLHGLNIMIEGSPGGAADERVLTRESIEEVGRSVKEFQSSTASDSDFVAGCKNITVSLSDITKALQKSCFDGKYLLILPTPDWDQISWEGQDYLTRKTLLQTAHAIFCGQEPTINWCLGKGDLDSDQFKKEFGCLKPSLHGSDAHTIEHLCKPENGKFCWIKSDLTFEGLKQIVYEPELRVRVQEEDPSESETYAKINSFAINLPSDLKIKDESGEKTDFCLNGIYSLELSNNLTCVIGGRGSGKSTLAHIIYNAWINHDPKKLNSINSPLLNLEMRPSALINVSKSTDCEVPSQTEFFFQNEIENAAKNISSMSSLIRNRLLRLSSIDGGETLFDLQDTWKTSSDSVSELVDAYDRISMIENEVSKAEENINTLRKQTEIIKSYEYKAFQTKIGELTSKIASFNSYKTDFEKLNKQIESLADTIDQLNWTDDQGKEKLSSLKQALESHKDELQATFTKYNNDYVTEDFPGQLKKGEQDLSEYLKDRGLSPENVQELTQANTTIKEYEEQIRLAQMDRKPYDQVYAAKNQTIDAYNTSYDAYKDRFQSVILSLQERLAGLSMSEKEITFSLEIDFSQV
ncbi:MAG: hypothetical protein JXI43_12895, partial [Tissierellales bacterium]|nr:hypothetical protein [Tissierellales bacterium]